MEKHQILIVEDDDTASFLMEEFLTDCGFKVNSVSTVTDGISYLKNKRYDLLLLDLSLPDFTGFDLISNIKDLIAIPTIVVSAHSDTETKVKSFKFGVNDYLTKPVDFLELEARIWALLSRTDNIRLAKEKDKKTFEIKNNQIIFKDEMLELTNVEYEILSILIKNKNQAISRDELANSLSSLSSHRSLDNHIKNLRKKIEVNSSTPNYLKTEYGLGYKLTF